MRLDRPTVVREHNFQNGNVRVNRVAAGQCAVRNGSVVANLLVGSNDHFLSYFFIIFLDVAHPTCRVSWGW